MNLENKRSCDRGLTQELLREYFDYSPDEGTFTWKKNYLTKKVGEKLSWKPNSKGYLKGNIFNGKGRLQHRMAWIYMTGEFPDEIDHFNRNPGDNRWSNLRDATRSDNMRNTSYNADTLFVYYHKKLDIWRSCNLYGGKEYFKCWSVNKYPEGVAEKKAKEFQELIASKSFNSKDAFMRVFEEEYILTLPNPLDYDREGNPIGVCFIMNCGPEGSFQVRQGDARCGNLVRSRKFSCKKYGGYETTKELAYQFAAGVF